MRGPTALRCCLDAMSPPLPNASISTQALYLRQGFWDFFGGANYRSFNTTGAGVGANSGTLLYNYSGFPGIGGAGTDTNGLSTARRALVDDALDYIGESHSLQHLPDQPLFLAGRWWADLLVAAEPMDRRLVVGVDPTQANWFQRMARLPQWSLLPGFRFVSDSFPTSCLSRSLPHIDPRRAYRHTPYL